MIETLIKLCAVDGISGYEDAVREAISELCQPYAEEVTTDVFGNLYILKKGEMTPEEPIAVTTTMGEYGFVLTEHGSCGSMKISQMDGMDARNIVGRRFHVVGSGLQGVISHAAQHVVYRSLGTAPEFKEQQFDFGATKKEEAEKYVNLGDTIVFDYPVEPFGENCLRGKALDCRIGCALMVELIKNVTPKYDTWFIFTAETGLEHRGAIPAARVIDPAILLGLGTCTAGDVPMQSDRRIGAKLRHGPAIPIKESKMMFSRRLNKLIMDGADRLGVKWQHRTTVWEGSDIGTMQVSASGFETAAITVPVRGKTSALPVAYIPDIEGAYAMAELFLKEVCFNA